MSDRALKLTELHQSMQGCARCGLANGRNVVVPGEGPADAEIVFIGEAPGYHEDRRGRPFIGPAGQFLDELLASVGLARRQVYITNVVKCRPPNNRDPQPDEIALCKDWLDQQLSVLDPLVICTLGRFSMARYLSATISKIHGQPRKIGSVWVLPLYHPAAALHQQSLRSVQLADIAQLPELLMRARRERAMASPTGAEPARSASAPSRPDEPKQLSMF